MSQKKITLQDVALLAGVSVSTVSRVMTGNASVADDKRAKVMLAAKQLGYRQNMLDLSAVGEPRRVIGIVTQHITNTFYGSIIYSIFDHLRHAEYSSLVADGRWSVQAEKSAIQTLQTQVDGLIVLGCNATDEDYIQLAKEIPLILVGRSLPALWKQCVWIDNERGAYEATRYLIEMGHHNIAFISGARTQIDAQQRQAGYERALREHGIEIERSLIVEGAFTHQSGVLAAEMLLSQRANFSAIFAANDLMAQGAILALYRRGIRVPQDVSIVGYDNQHGSGYALPPLTTVKQPSKQLGIVAAQNMLNLLEGNDLIEDTLVPKLIMRESVTRNY